MMTQQCYHSTTIKKLYKLFQYVGSEKTEQLSTQNKWKRTLTEWFLFDELFFEYFYN